MRHIISILMQNEAGALARVAALFSSRGYNIESLSVAPTNDVTVSRLTLVTTGTKDVIDQISKQVLKLVDVVGTANMTITDHIERELLMIKVSVEKKDEARMVDLVKKANSRVLDDNLETYTLELTGATQHLDEFIAKVADFADIIAVVRSGAMAISRGKKVLSKRA